MAAHSCRGLPAELAAKLVVKEALRSRRLKDDTTYLAFDIIPYDHPAPAPITPRKKHNMLSSLLFGKKALNSTNKASNKLSAVGVVEDLFEEGSAMLAERLGKEFPLNTSSGLFKCAVCQVDQLAGDGLTGLSLAVSSYNSEDVLVSFGGYNGRYNSEIHVLKPSHKSTLQSKIKETPVPDSISAVHNATNATRDVESEFEVGQEGKIREIVMDNIDSDPRKSKGGETTEHLIATLKSEKEELESSLSKEKLQSIQLKEELAEAETRNTELYKELQSIRGQLAAEQSRCFKLEVDVAELRQKLQAMETLQKELELLQRQKAASEQALLNAKQRHSSGGVWGPPPSEKADDA